MRGLYFGLLAIVALGLGAASGAAASEDSISLHLGSDIVDGSADVLCDSGFQYPILPAGETPADGKAYSARSFTAQACGVAFTFAAPVPFTLRSGLDALLLIGCDVPTVNPGTPATSSGLVRLLKNDDQIGPDFRFSTGPGVCLPGAEEPVTASFGEAAGVSFAAGDRLSLFFVTFMASPSGLDPAHNVYVLTGSDGSTITAAGIPAAADAAIPAPATHYEVIEGDTLSSDSSFTEPTSDTYVYNWTTDLSDVEVEYDATVENGSATITILDGEGTTLIDARLTGTIAEVKEIGTAAPGDWQVRIQYDDFVGSLGLEIRARAQQETETPDGSAGESNGQSGTGTTTPEGNEGGNATQEPAVQAAGDVGEGAPGPGVLVVLAAVGLLAAAMRRRRA